MDNSCSTSEARGVLKLMKGTVSGISKFTSFQQNIYFFIVYANYKDNGN